LQEEGEKGGLKIDFAISAQANSGVGNPGFALRIHLVLRYVYRRTKHLPFNS